MTTAQKRSCSHAVQELRNRLGLSQTDLGLKLGVSPMAISRWEAGTNEPPGTCVVQLAKLSQRPETFWYFLGQIGLQKRDFRGRT
jgi:transcriptional regulator with XRE-family HTH domain